MATPMPPPPPPPNTVPPPNPPPVPQDAPPQQEPQAPKQEIPDPGPWDQLGLEAQQILFYPNTFFEGLRVNFMRGASKNLQVSHVVQLGSAKDANYTFSPTYIGPIEREGTQQTYPVVLANWDTSGTMMSQIIHEVRKGVMVKFVGQNQQGKWGGAQLEVARTGSDYTSSFTMANLNPFKRSGVLVANYLQKLGSFFTAGAELVYHSADGHEQPSLSAALRYRTPDNSFTAKICPSQANLTMSYYHKQDPKTAFATDMTVDAARGIAVASFGWQGSYRTGVFRGLFNTRGEVAAQVEQDIIPQIMGISYNAVLDHMKGDCKIGFGFNLNS